MKTGLNSSFIADKIVSNNTDSIIVDTKKEKVFSNKAIDTDLIALCNHEEADTLMSLHAKHAALGSIKSVNKVSYNTDDLVKGVALFDELNVDQLWITFGKGNDLQWMPIYSIVRSLDFAILSCVYTL